jgi:hypothetical protein
MPRAKAKPRGPELSAEEKHARRLREAGVVAGREQHDTIVIEETMAAGQKRARVTTECMIDLYHARMSINDRAWMAGTQLRRLLFRAIHSPSVTGSYGEQRGNGGGGDPNIDARHVLRSTLEGAGLARRFMQDAAPLRLTESGLELWMERYPTVLTFAGNVAIDVCGMDNWAGGTERLAALRSALGALADYWKISGDESDELSLDGKISKRYI